MKLSSILFLALLPTKTTDTCTATQDALVAYVARVTQLQEELARVRTELLVCRKRHGMRLEDF